MKLRSYRITIQNCNTGKINSTGFFPVQDYIALNFLRLCGIKINDIGDLFVCKTDLKTLANCGNTLYNQIRGDLGVSCDSSSIRFMIACAIDRECCLAYLYESTEFLIIVKKVGEVIL